MTFLKTIDAFLTDVRAQGRINSDRSDRAYRDILVKHAQDARKTPATETDRATVKETLRRWPNPNTQRKARSILVSFYDWMMEEGLRADNPARQTPRPKKRPTQVYRLTREEVVGMLTHARPGREHRAIYLGICAGLRNAELRGLKGRHFHREGYVWVSADIAKGARERWVPVIADLEPVCREIRETTESDEFVLPAVRWRNPPFNTERTSLKYRALSSQALRTLVMEVGKRAGIRAHIHPHLMRHAFGDHIARYAGIKNAQAVLGHANVGTTETYVGEPTLDELAVALDGFGFFPVPPSSPQTSGTGIPAEGDEALVESRSPSSRREGPESPGEAPTGIEPVSGESRLDPQSFIFDSESLRTSVGIYLDHFDPVEDDVVERTREMIDVLSRAAMAPAPVIARDDKLRAGGSDA